MLLTRGISMKITTRSDDAAQEESHLDLAACEWTRLDGRNRLVDGVLDPLAR